MVGEGRRPSSGARLGVDGGEGWPPAPTPMLVKVTVTVAVWAVGLVGSGTNATVPLPEQGRVSEVGIGALTA